MTVLVIKCEDQVLWLNDCAQFYRWCRPLRLAYEKETTASVAPLPPYPLYGAQPQTQQILFIPHFTPQQQKPSQPRLYAEVSNFIQHALIHEGKNVTVTHNAGLTSLDGKALNNVIENDCTRCPICTVHITRLVGGSSTRNIMSWSWDSPL